MIIIIIYISNNNNNISNNIKQLNNPFTRTSLNKITFALNRSQTRNLSNKVKLPKAETVTSIQGSKKEERRGSHEKRAIRDVRPGRQESLFFEVCIAYKCLGVKSEQHAPNESGC